MNRAAFEAWYDAQPDGRIQPWDVWQAAVANTHAELAKPARCAQCGYQYGHQIGCVNNPVDIALSKQAIRAELAKLVEDVAALKAERDAAMKDDL